MMHIFSEEEIVDNRERFLNLLTPAIKKREGDLESLLKTLDDSDFWIAPASTKYHNSVRGGLCAHCLNVYDNLKMLVEQMGYGEVISEDSIAIVALLHDFSKRKFYEQYIQNKKVYSDIGSKHDEMGKFDWVAVPAWKVRDDIFLYGNHEMTSEYMIRQFVNLSYSESIAVLHHHGGMSDDCAKDNIGAIYNKYPLALLLHQADMLAAYIQERYE